MNLDYNPNNNTLSEPTQFTKFACNIWDTLSNRAKFEWFIRGADQFVDHIAELTAHIASEAELTDVYVYISPYSLD